MPEKVKSLENNRIRAIVATSQFGSRLMCSQDDRFFFSSCSFAMQPFTPLLQEMIPTLTVNVMLGILGLVPKDGPCHGAMTALDHASENARKAREKRVTGRACKDKKMSLRRLNTRFYDQI
jgi:hypothetical protein